MPMKVRWGDDEKRFIVWEYIGAFTEAEIYEGFKVHNAMIEEIGRQVPVLTDMRATTHVPYDPLAFFQKLSAHPEFPANPNETISVTVTPEQFHHDALKVHQALENPMALRSYIYKSYDEALAKIYEYLDDQDKEDAAD